jgi:hypothetical protein
MQVLISPSRPSLLFRTMSGSAKNGRAMDTRSAHPPDKIDSTVDGALILFVAHSGTETIFSSRSFFVAKEKAPRGTLVAMVAIYIWRRGRSVGRFFRVMAEMMRCGGKEKGEGGGTRFRE